MLFVGKDEQRDGLLYMKLLADKKYGNDGAEQIRRGATRKRPKLGLTSLDLQSELLPLSGLYHSPGIRNKSL